MNRICHTSPKTQVMRNSLYFTQESTDDRVTFARVFYLFMKLSQGQWTYHDVVVNVCERSVFIWYTRSLMWMYVQMKASCPFLKITAPVSRNAYKLSTRHEQCCLLTIHSSGPGVSRGHISIYCTFVFYTP